MADIQGNLWLCTDCTFAQEGFSPEERGIPAEELTHVLKEIPANWQLATNYDSQNGTGIQDFARKWCDGCGRYIGDTYHRYAHFEREG